MFYYSIFYRWGRLLPRHSIVSLTEILSPGILSYLYWDFVPWDFVLRDFVPWDFVPWDSVRTPLSVTIIGLFLSPCLPTLCAISISFLVMSGLIFEMTSNAIKSVFPLPTN